MCWLTNRVWNLSLAYTVRASLLPKIVDIETLLFVSFFFSAQIPTQSERGAEKIKFISFEAAALNGIYMLPI